MRRFLGHALKGLSLLLWPVFFGLFAATVRGWKELFSNPRLLAGWSLLLGFSLFLPTCLGLAGRTIFRHETAKARKRVWETGIATLALGAIALLVVPWRELASWLSETLSSLTGVPLLVPESAP